MSNLKYHIHVKAETDQELRKELIEVSAILVGLYESTQKWKEEYGYDNLKKMQYWQYFAKEWIEKHKIPG